jgi:glycerophosphoryl diester phosphodiesterase
VNIYRKRFFGLSVIIGVAAGILAFANTAHALDLQGHRGARGLMPENTLPAFAKALSIGVSTLELDLGVTIDNQVVVFHNNHLAPELVRGPDGKWLSSGGDAVHAMTLSDIKTFDVGRLNPDSKYAARYPNQMAIDGTRIPILAEVFELVNKSGNTTVRFNIETKLNPHKPSVTPSPQDFVEAVLKVVNAYGMDTRTTIQSFDWRTLQEVQRRAPKISTAYLTASQRWLDTIEAGKPGPSPWMATFDVDDFEGSIQQAIKAAGGTIWSPFHREVDRTAVEAAHKIGLKVKVWTVNKPARMIEMIDMGVDGIITDFPDVLRKVMKDRDMTLPISSPVTP